MIRTKGRVRRAFTLIEVMIVIAIILAISGLVGVALFQQRDKAKDNLVRVDLRTLKAAMDQFRLVYDRYPTDEEGLSVLWSDETLDPDAPEGSWQSFLESPMPRDQYGHEWVYLAEGDTREGYYDLFSVGRDGEEDTEDDISVWEGLEDSEEDFGFDAPTDGG
ncbi:MAG: type II secretion system major pseudopilin GspG [Phycisphaerales bacterium JB039]